MDIFLSVITAEHRILKNPKKLYMRQIFVNVQFTESLGASRYSSNKKRLQKSFKTYICPVVELGNGSHKFCLNYLSSITVVGTTSYIIQHTSTVKFADKTAFSALQIFLRQRDKNRWSLWIFDFFSSLNKYSSFQTRVPIN